MNSLPSWLTSSLFFLEGFAFASVIAGAIYGMWRSRSVYVQIIAYIFEFFVVLASVCGFLLLMYSEDIKYASGVVGMVLAFSVGQAFFERAIDPQMRSVGHHRTRTFIAYLCAAAMGLLALVIAEGLSHMDGEPPTPLLSLDESSRTFALLSGYGTGFFFTPLSISYFRYLFPNFRLSRGGERPLVVEKADTLQDVKIVGDSV